MRESLKDFITDGSGWKLTQRLPTGQCAVRVLRTLGRKWDVSIQPLPSGFRELSRRGRRKIVRARRNA